MSPDSQSIGFISNWTRRRQTPCVSENKVGAWTT